MDDQEEVISLTENTEQDLDALTDRGDVVTPEQHQDAPITTDADAPADDAATSEETSRPSGRIPKARFDEVNNERKAALQAAEEARERADALARELQALRQGAQPPAQAAPQPAAPEFDVDAKESAYIDALMDGDRAAATAIRKEINAHISQQAAHEASRHTEAELTQRQAAAALQAESVKAIADFPYLDQPEGAEALELILASRDSKIARGIVPHIALRDAVKSIAPRFAPAETPSGGLPKSGQATDTRTAAAIARGAADASLQPPAVQAGIGARATAGRVNVEALTDEQFDNLSDADKRRLRGD